ncbi:phosphatase PAP2 family protein [Streptomyces sp. NRRL S-350]|uniref:phosphatase PAP2 family protein n=1 Tax=Streptomyces sp. NRRL S-350 TaxID=1463902 RepID=UPI00068B1B86|nr:phosphatase PAP2 family protein [Streptomyces sp. NRRL S-350]
MARGVAGPARGWPAAAVAAGLLFTALAVLLGTRGWAPFGFERAAVDWSAAHRPPAARTAAVAVTSLGSGVAPYLLALAAGYVTVRARPAARPPGRAVPVLLAPVLWLVAGQLLRLGLVHAFARPRPPRASWGTTAAGFSFPSGHAFTSAVCAGLLAVCVARARPSVGRVTGGAVTTGAVTVAAVFAVSVGLSRVYLGVHWPLDVLGGWLLAAMWLAIGTAVLRLPGRTAARRGARPPVKPPGA